MLRLLVAWALFRLVRATLAAGVVLALGIALFHSQFAGAEHSLSGSGLSTLSHTLRHDVQRAVQHALRPVPGTR
jgi:hypothetical protein